MKAASFLSKTSIFQAECCKSKCWVKAHQARGKSIASWLNSVASAAPPTQDGSHELNYCSNSNSQIKGSSRLRRLLWENKRRGKLGKMLKISGSTSTLLTFKISTLFQKMLSKSLTSNLTASANISPRTMRAFLVTELLWIKSRQHLRLLVSAPL